MTSGERFVALHEGSLRVEEHGQKAALLAQAVALGEPVPEGFAITARDAASLMRGDATLKARLGASLSRLKEKGVSAVAVRSSPCISLPGALKTELSVPCELEPVHAALRRVVSSMHEPATLDQLRARGQSAPDAPWCGVLVQAYLSPEGTSSRGMVVCTRDPNSGELGPFGEHAPHAGAQEVVSGRSTPHALRVRDARVGMEDEALERKDPALYAKLCALVTRLEQAYGEPLELELLYTQSALWLLQVRPLVLSARAQVRLALDAVASDSPSYVTWLRRVADEALPQLIEERFPHPESIPTSLVVARGLAASPGVGRGVLVIDLESAVARARAEDVVLVRRDAVPEDVAAFRAAKGVLTTSGGLTSHAAVIARGLRIPAVVGASQVRVDVKARCIFDGRDATRVLAREGDRVSLDAHRGVLYRGDIELEAALLAPELEELLREAQKLRRVPLWVRGPLTKALRLRASFGLDGLLGHSDEAAIVAQCTGESVLPEVSGKDVWLEVPVEHASVLTAQLSNAYSFLLCGPVNDDLIRAIRERSRMRQVGVRADEATGLTEPVDLVVLRGREGPGAVPLRGPKIVRMVDADTDYADASHESGRILACDSAQVLRYALGLATVSRNQGSSADA